MTNNQTPQPDSPSAEIELERQTAEIVYKIPTLRRDIAVNEIMHLHQSALDKAVRAAKLEVWEFIVNGDVGSEQTLEEYAYGQIQQLRAGQEG